MKIIDEVLSTISMHRFSDSSQLMAQALLSACSSRYHAPSCLLASVSLDSKNNARLQRLMRITHEIDFNNTDQDDAIESVLDLFPNLSN